MTGYKRSRKALKISLALLIPAQLLMIFPLSLWERFGPGPDIIVYSPISYYNWFALVGRGGNWPAVAVSVLMPLWLALTLWRLRPERKTWVGATQGFFGCGVLLLNLVMDLNWDYFTPVGWILLALQLAAVVMQFWPERRNNKEESL